MCLGVAVKELGGVTADSGWCIVRGARLAHLLARRALAAAAAAADARDTNSSRTTCGAGAGAGEGAGHANSASSSSSSSTVGTVQEAGRLCVLKALWAVAHILKSIVYSAIVNRLGH